MTDLTQKAQQARNWLTDPLTRGYVHFLQFKEKFFTQQVQLIVENAIVSGNHNRTPEEISAFNLLKNYREILQDLTLCFEIAHKEKELTEQDVTELEEFFETLTKK